MVIYMKVRTRVFKCIAGILSCILVLSSMSTSIVSCLADDSVHFTYSDNNVSVDVAAPDKSVIPEDAKLVVTPVTVTDNMKTAVNNLEGADEQEDVLETADSVNAYDIHFQMEDGTQIEPDGNVTVSIKQADTSFGGDSKVFHVDDQTAVAEEMQSRVDDAGAVLFQTNHFSTFLTANYKAVGQVTLTLKICDDNADDDHTQLFEDLQFPYTGSQTINIADIIANWNTSGVWKFKSSRYVDDVNYGNSKIKKNKFTITHDTTVIAYVSGADQQDVSGNTTFYDYLVKPWHGSGNQWWGEHITDPDKSINTVSNYSDPNSAANNMRFGVGIGADAKYNSQNYPQNSYNAYNAYGMDADAYNENRVTTGIVSGLSEDYTSVLFNFDEPGLFSNESKTGKTVLNGYNLQFARNGLDYELQGVTDPDGNWVAGSGSNFFPLDDAASNTNDDGYGSAHNYYFGMRYDIAFTTGNYVGPMNYSFTGDDDLWVLLDGEVVMDLGGIHSAVSDIVDIRKVLEDRNDTDPDTVHHLTVLYMERGGNASNCSMKFTIPNAAIEGTQPGSLNFTKTDESGKGLSGAEFTLTNDANASEVYTAVSATNGSVTFDGLAAGTYTLAESQAPDGYQVSDQKYQAVVTVNKKKQTTDVSLYKMDQAGNVDKSAVITKIANTKTAETPKVPTIDNLLQDKTATVADWDQRTYNIDLYASHNLKVSKPVNLVMALDISGSMPWFVSQPTGGVTYLGNLTEADRNSQNLSTGGSTGVGAWKYQYYVLRESESGAMEYKPIGYSTDGSWRYIKSKSDGSKVFSTNSDGKVSANEKIYIRGTADQTKLEALQTSVTNFVKNLQTVSPDSQIGFVFFAGDVVSSTDLATIGSVSLSSQFDRIVLHGSTNQEVALQKAEEIVNKANNDNAKNILLFSDGQPNKDGISVSSVNEVAQDIKDNGIQLYTAGIFKDMSNAGCQGLQQWASEGCAFVADSATGLVNAFNSAFAALNVSLDNVTVRDYIDARFDLIDADGNVVTSGNYAGGTVGSDDNGVYVEWTQQKLGFAADPVNGWHESLLIKAKDAFIGGNKITTNGPESAVIVDGQQKNFEQPDVNVKTDLTIQDVNDVIFYGDQAADADRALDQILQNSYTIGSDGSELKKSDFTVNWFSDSECSVPLDPSEIKADQDQTCYVKVSYPTGEPTDKSTANTAGHKADGTAMNTQADPDRDYAVYSIKVVKGQLDLGKIIDEQYSDISQINAEQTFIFKIEQYSVNKDNSKGELVATYYQTLSFDANGKIVQGNATISGLKKGYYTVTEESGWSDKYQLKSTSDNSLRNTEQGVDLFIGEKTAEATDAQQPVFYGLEQKDAYLAVADGEAAEVTFINNKKKDWKWISDVASAVNRFLQ